MNMDLPFIAAVVGELQRHVAGAAVRKIYQPGAEQILLQLWTGRDNPRLLICCSAGAARLHLTERAFVNPAAPPRFCQLLRARLSRLHSIEQQAGERVVLIRGSGGDGKRVTLVVELFAPRPNLLLLDDSETIIDLLIRRDEPKRPLRPGFRYQAPVVLSGVDLDQELPNPPLHGDPVAWLKTLRPMTPLLAADLLAGAASGLPLEELVSAFAESWHRREFSPLIGLWRGERVLSAYAPSFLQLATVLHFTSPSAAAEAFYAAETSESFLDGELLLQRLNREVERLHRRLEQLAIEEGRWAKAERDKERGDLLLANLHLIRPGCDSVTVIDWFADPPIPLIIPLDPTLSAQQNAERCYARRRKAQRAVEHLERRRSETLGELAWFSDLQLAVSEAENPADLAAVHDQMVEAGLLTRRQQPIRQLKRTVPDGGLHSSVSPGGYRLIWGKHPAGNDEVSRRLTAADDLWFHAHARPGCHLVLKRDGRTGEIPPADQLFAAALAAGYSHGRDDNRVEVMVCRGDQVRKPKGARPGQVTVEHFTTMIVRPRRLEKVADGEGRKGKTGPVS